jgi:hypothetical protein
MQRKKKPCKGNYRSNHFEGCNELVHAYKYGLCKPCFIEWCYSTGEGSQYLRKQIIPQAKKEVERKQKASDKKQREKLKTLSQLEAEARKYFQRYIRLRDQDKPCPSCGTYTADLWDGGHFYKAEIYSGLIFDERNCHKQCRKCNRFLGGNENNYRLGLIHRFSKEYVLQLDADAIQKRDYKYSREELLEIKAHYKQKIKSI